MERGDSSNLQRRHVNPRSSSAGVVIREPGNITNNSSSNNNNNNNNLPCKREQDQYIPIANVIKIMRSILPPQAKIADDVKEIVQECVSEFISFITSEANERSKLEKRKTLNAEDVLWAMDELGFDNYVEPLTLFLNRHRQHEYERTSVHGEPVVKKTVEFVQPQPPVTMPPSGGGPGVSMARHHPAALNGYKRNATVPDGHAGSSHSNAPYGLPGFDPYAHFK